MSHLVPFQIQTAPAQLHRPRVHSFLKSKVFNEFGLLKEDKLKYLNSTVYCAVQATAMKNV